MKKAPAAATMATKPWPMAKTLPVPLNVDGEAAGEPPAGVLVEGVTPAGAGPVAAGLEPLPATGYGVAAAAAVEAAKVDAGAEVWADMTIMLWPALVVATWELVCSPGAEMSEVGAVATEPVAWQGNVSRRTSKHCAPWVWL